MPLSLVVLHLVGAVMLLLWAVRMVRTGVERASGLALNVLVSGDLGSARQLMREKERMRELERDSHDQHLRRLQAELVESIETSNVHLALVRALKEINSLLATVAYPILSEHGLLSETRMRASV